MGRQPLIGLIGGIGAGKSTAAACFARLGCAVIDADQMAHEMLRHPEVIQKVADRFGGQVLSEDGFVDRKKLASVVFTCRENLDALTGIIHPPILARCEKMIALFQQDLSVKAVVLDMPLLLETGWEKRCDALVFIECGDEKRAERAGKKEGLDIEQQKKRENFQISLDKKKQIAHYIVDNNSDESELAKQVEKVLSAIRDRR